MKCMTNLYHITVCLDCLGFGFVLSTNEYIAVASAMKETLRKTGTLKDVDISISRIKAPREPCACCKGTGFVFSASAATTTLPSRTIKRW